MTTIGVWSSISHRHVTSLGVLDGEIFIVELVTIDGLTTSAVSGGEVTTLSHESLDDTVERAALEVERLA